MHDSYFTLGVTLIKIRLCCNRHLNVRDNVAMCSHIVCLKTVSLWYAFHFIECFVVVGYLSHTWFVVFVELEDRQCEPQKIFC